jgi:hypothetical protein
MVIMCVRVAIAVVPSERKPVFRLLAPLPILIVTVPVPSSPVQSLKQAVKDSTTVSAKTDKNPITLFIARLLLAKRLIPQIFGKLYNTF